MWWCFCLGPRTSRFRSVAQPTLNRLQKAAATWKTTGQTYARVALEKKREAATYYRQGDDYMARATAMEAVTHEKMAMRYLEMVQTAQGRIEQVHQLWATHDKLDDAGATAEDLRSLGVVQKDELEGTDKVLSIEARIDAANKMVDNFSQLVQETDCEIRKVSTGVCDDNADDLLKQVQRWASGQFNSPEQMRNMAPAELEMD